MSNVQSSSLRRHVVIAGTGRAGTTLLVEILTACGLDTGYSLEDVAEHKDNISNAGLEHSLTKPNCPYLVKDPFFYSYADDVFNDPKVVIDHVFIPIRELFAAAESRRSVNRQNLIKMTWRERLNYKRFPYTFAGGVFVESRSKGKLEDVLLSQLTELLLKCSRYHVPITLLHFPTLAKEPEYLFEKLSPILKEMSLKEFKEVFSRVVKPELVHKYNKLDV